MSGEAILNAENSEKLLGVRCSAPNPSAEGTHSAPRPHSWWGGGGGCCPLLKNLTPLSAFVSSAPNEKS